MLLALLTHERDRRTVRAAVPAGAKIRFVAHAVDLRPSWPEGRPTAVLIELADAEGRSPVPALAAFRRHAPRVPVCAYVPLTADLAHEVMHLTVRGLMTEVVFVPDDDLRARLRHLLGHPDRRDETTALRRVWRRWTPAALRDIVGACVAASDGAASVADVAGRLNRSPRTLERQLVQAGLPPPHRVLRWSRLLRAAYRLEQPGASIKRIAAELGYPSPHALAQRLHRHTGLTLTELRTGGFGGLEAYVQARLLAAQTRAVHRVRKSVPRRA